MGVCWIMDIGLNHGGVRPKFVSFNQGFRYRVLVENLGDFPPSLLANLGVQFVEFAKRHHGAISQTAEFPETIIEMNSDRSVPIAEIFKPHKDNGPKGLFHG